MKESFRFALLSIAVASLVSIGALAQTSDASSTGQSTDTQGSAAHHAKGAMDKSSVNAIDHHFVKKAAQGSLAEVELGKMATEKGQSDEVKKFGQRMIDDHTRTNDQLKQLASSKGITLPNDLDAKDKATKKRLSKLSGEQFDRAYMNDMVTDHTKDVSDFKKESTGAKDADIKNFASQILPTLEDHLKEARNIAPKENNEAAQK